MVKLSLLWLQGNTQLLLLLLLLLLQPTAKQVMENAMESEPPRDSIKEMKCQQESTNDTTVEASSHMISSPCFCVLDHNSDIAPLLIDEH